MSTATIHLFQKDDFVQMGMALAHVYLLTDNFATEQKKAKLGELVKSARVSYNEKSLKNKKGKVMVTLNWYHFNEKKNKFCQIKEINGGGKVCPRLKYDDTLEPVFETMKNSFFPEGKNGIAKLCDLIVVICSSRMIVVDDFKTTLEEYKDKNGNLKFILRTKQLTKIQMIERRTLLLVFQVTLKAILSNQRKRQK